MRYQTHCRTCFAVLHGDSEDAAQRAASEHEAKRACVAPAYDSVKGAWIKMDLTREEDGRWLVSLPDYSGIMAYGSTPELARAAALGVYALRC